MKRVFAWRFHRGRAGRGEHVHRRGVRRGAARERDDHVVPDRPLRAARRLDSQRRVCPTKARGPMTASCLARGTRLSSSTLVR